MVSADTAWGDLIVASAQKHKFSTCHEQKPQNAFRTMYFYISYHVISHDIVSDQIIYHIILYDIISCTNYWLISWSLPFMYWLISWSVDPLVPKKTQRPGSRRQGIGDLFHDTDSTSQCLQDVRNNISYVCKISPYIHGHSFQSLPWQRSPPPNQNFQAPPSHSNRFPQKKTNYQIIHVIAWGIRFRWKKLAPRLGSFQIPCFATHWSTFVKSAFWLFISSGSTSM